MRTIEDVRLRIQNEISYRSNRTGDFQRGYVSALRDILQITFDSEDLAKPMSHSPTKDEKEQE